jgi:hypothetical protein
MSDQPEYELEKLVTLQTFSSSWEAELARACLETEGIHAVIADEHFFRLYGALSHTMGGLRLQVRPEDADCAAELLRNRRPVLYLVTDDDLAPGEPLEADEPEALITIGRYPTPWEAHLAKTFLESEGIDACVLEERLPGVSLLTGAPTGMSRLEVHPWDAERALEILASVGAQDIPASET